MKNFTYYVPTKIHFGKGMISHAFENYFSPIKDAFMVEKTAEFFFDVLGLPRTLTEVGIGEEKLELMAENCAPKLANAFVPLTKEDVLAIFKDCL